MDNLQGASNFEKFTNEFGEILDRFCEVLPGLSLNPAAQPYLQLAARQLRSRFKLILALGPPVEKVEAALPTVQ